MPEAVPMCICLILVIMFVLTCALHFQYCAHAIYSVHLPPINHPFSTIYFLRLPLFLFSLLAYSYMFLYQKQGARWNSHLPMSKLKPIPHHCHKPRPSQMANLSLHYPVRSIGLSSSRVWMKAAPYPMSPSSIPTPVNKPGRAYDTAFAALHLRNV